MCDLSHMNFEKIEAIYSLTCRRRNSHIRPCVGTFPYRRQVLLAIPINLQGSYATHAPVAAVAIVWMHMYEFDFVRRAAHATQAHNSNGAKWCQMEKRKGKCHTRLCNHKS